MCAVALITKKWGQIVNIMHRRVKNCNEYFGPDSVKLSAFEDGEFLLAAEIQSSGNPADIDLHTEVPRNRISKRGWLSNPSAAGKRTRITGTYHLAIRLSLQKRSRTVDNATATLPYADGN
jgi:hypothetical protein